MTDSAAADYTVAEMYRDEHLEDCPAEVAIMPEADAEFVSALDYAIEDSDDLQAMLDVDGGGEP